MKKYPFLKNYGKLIETVLFTGGDNETNAGTVSRTKEEYDENGNLVKVTVNVTYTDEDGKSQRTRVVIDNPQGGDN